MQNYLMKKELKKKIKTLVRKSGKFSFMEAKHYKAFLTYAHMKRKFTHPDEKGKWIIRIDYFWARDKEYGDEIVLRNTKGAT